MKKKIYKKPVSRWAVVDSEEILQIEADLFHPSGFYGSVENQRPAGDDDENFYSKGGSWEMDW